MSNDLNAIAEMLKRLQDAGVSEEAKRTAAMTDALQSISAALTELVSIAEGDDDAKEPAQTQAIADAIKGLKFPEAQVTVEAPTVNVAAPVVNVPAQPVSLKVEAGPNNVHVTAQPADVVVMPAETWAKIKVEFDYRCGYVTGATITRE